MYQVLLYCSFSIRYTYVYVYQVRTGIHNPNLGFENANNYDLQQSISQGTKRSIYWLTKIQRRITYTTITILLYHC
jgi:hypothetical protein